MHKSQFLYTVTNICCFLFFFFNCTHPNVHVKGYYGLDLHFPSAE